MAYTYNQCVLYQITTSPIIREHGFREDVTVVYIILYYFKLLWTILNLANKRFVRHRYNHLMLQGIDAITVQFSEEFISKRTVR